MNNASVSLPTPRRKRTASGRFGPGVRGTGALGKSKPIRRLKYGHAITSEIQSGTRTTNAASRLMNAKTHVNTSAIGNATAKRRSVRDKLARKVIDRSSSPQG